MKKIPTLFERIYENDRVVGILPEVKPGLEWVLEGEGIATLKIDGSCCAIIDSKFYKRFDAKNGRKIPEGAIPCCEPDTVTGHWPHWVKVDFDDPGNKWLVEAFNNKIVNGRTILEDGTYEAIGPHFQDNPHMLKEDILIPHGESVIPDFPRTFDGMKKYLEDNWIEGVVFWKDGEPMCKIKRSDFGFGWNNTKRGD
jgi:hypothetical protein